MRSWLKSIAQTAYDQYLEAAGEVGGLEAADAAIMRQVEAGDIGDQIDLSVGGIDGQGASAGPGGQLLNDVVGVGEVLADDGEAAYAAAIGGIDESAVRVVAD